MSAACESQGESRPAADHDHPGDKALKMLFFVEDFSLSARTAETTQNLSVSPLVEDTEDRSGDLWMVQVLGASIDSKGICGNLERWKRQKQRDLPDRIGIVS